MQEATDVVSALRTFLSLRVGDYFGEDFGELKRTLFHEVRAEIVDGEILSHNRIDCIGNLEIARAAEDFGERLADWIDAREERRDEIMYTAEETSDNLREAYGDELCNELENIRNDARRLMASLEKLNNTAIEPPPPPASKEYLTENDAGLLDAMLTLGATSDSPASREMILEEARWTSEGKRAFDRLKQYGLVAAQPGVGYWLTGKGLERAKKMRGAH